MINTFLVSFFILSHAQMPEAPRPAFKIQSRNGASVEEIQEKYPSIEKAAITSRAPKQPSSRVVINADENTLFIGTRSAQGTSGSPFVEMKPQREKFKGLLRSSILKARINDSITAYSTSKEPVRATITDGPYQGAVLFGNATMDKTTKNVIVAFDTFIPPDSNETFKFLATIKDQEGNSGLVGVLESKYWQTFFMHFGLVSASAAANASAQYSQNQYGGYSAAPTADNAVRQGVAGGFNKMADRVQADSQDQQEFVTVQGPVYIRVYVLEQPEKN